MVYRPDDAGSVNFLVPGVLGLNTRAPGKFFYYDMKYEALVDEGGDSSCPL
jgi:hypothetical protein